MICRSKKAENRKGKILLINAVDEVTRKNAESFLELKHINRIADVYEKFTDIEGLAKVVSIRDVEAKDFSLSISLYVETVKGSATAEQRTVQECFLTWNSIAGSMVQDYEKLISLMGDKNNG